MNYTPEYNANPALQGAINTISTVNFNPAGLMQLEDGTYVSGGVQLSVGRYKMEALNNNYKSKHANPLPSLSIFTKNSKRAYFWTFGGIAGGAGLEYKHGVPIYDILSHKYSALGKIASGSKADGGNSYVQTTLGTAFNLTNKLSMSIAARAVYGERNFKGTLRIQEGTGVLGGQEAYVDAKRDAWGFGAQVGLNYAATDRLNIGFRYDSKVRMKFKTKTTEDPIVPSNETVAGAIQSIFGSNVLGFSTIYPEYADGAKVRRDLPTILALGAQYKVTENWLMFAGGNLYFNKSANLDVDIAKSPEDRKRKKYGTGWELSLGSEYWFTPKMAWLVGVNYAHTGASHANYKDSEFALNSWLLGTGLKYKYSPTLDLVASTSHYFYKSDTAENMGVPVKYKKGITTLGVGFSKKF
jgi:long-chain fatty acid transport protein